MQPLVNLTGRRYIVTGAASGIGRSTAILLSALGADLLLVDLQQEACQVLIDGQQLSATALKLDLGDVGSIKQGIRVALGERRVNGFVHCAGLPYITPLNAISVEKSEHIFRVNTLAALELAKVCSSKQVYSGSEGSFVFISSVYGLVGSAANVVYAMTKSALLGITKSLAVELAPKGIRVNTVAPGFIKTPMMEQNRDKFDTEYLQALEKLHPLGLGDPQAIAEPIAFLLSGAGRWITGTVLSVDGGFTAQ